MLANTTPLINRMLVVVMLWPFFPPCSCSFFHLCVLMRVSWYNDWEGEGVSRATALYAAYGAHPARPLKPSPLRFFVDLGFSQKHHCSDFLWICDSYKKHHGSDFLWIFTKNISALIFCGFGIFTKNITALIFTKNTTALIFLWFWDFYKKHHRSDFLWIWDFHQHHSDFLRSGVHLGFSPISIFFPMYFQCISD